MLLASDVQPLRRAVCPRGFSAMHFCTDQMLGKRSDRAPIPERYADAVVTVTLSLGSLLELLFGDVSSYFVSTEPRFSV